MQTPTIETKQDSGIIEVPGSELVPVSEPNDVPLNREITTVPEGKEITEVLEEKIENVTTVAPKVGIGYKIDVSSELGLIGEATGKGLPSDIAKESLGDVAIGAIDSKIKNLSPKY